MHCLRCEPRPLPLCFRLFFLLFLFFFQPRSLAISLVDGVTNCIVCFFFFFLPSHLPVQDSAFTIDVKRASRRALPVQLQALITFQIKVSLVSVLEGALGIVFFFYPLFFKWISEDVYVRDIFFYCKQRRCFSQECCLSLRDYVVCFVKPWSGCSCRYGEVRPLQPWG